MTPAQLSRTVLLSLRGVVGDAGLPGAELPERVVIESPPRRGNGDYGTGVALQLARAVALASAVPVQVQGVRGRAGAGPQPPPSPLELAQLLGERLARLPGVARTEVAGAGFVNVTLDASGRAALVRELARPGHASSAADDPARDAARWAAATETAAATPKAAVGDRDRAALPGAASVPAAHAALLVRTAASPLFRVQYAHSRARALLRGGAALGVRPEAGARGYAYDDPAERTLLALLADHHRVAAQAAPAQAPASGSSARHVRHLTALADAFFDARDACPPLPQGDEKPEAVHRARLALAEAAGTVLAGGLAQLGVTAPAHL